MSGAKVLGGEKLKAALKKLAAAKGARVRVGILENTKYPDGTDAAMVAGVQEFGNEQTPARSFMRRTVSERVGAWKNGFANQLDANSVEGALDVLGEQMAKDIQSTILKIAGEGGNAPSTIERKRSKQDRPLIDSTLMLNSVKHEVVPGESE
ncbi:hypothetical protein ACIQVE_21395 [Pseudomonas sp. NPDC098747]|uniref:hypothetical protein n=1 Tax=Pseudomonas sp. NPDC098747 TaxID=3364487 RepID=UPI00383BE7A9